MKIINPNIVNDNRYSIIQITKELPNDCVEVICDDSDFYKYSGYVILTIEDNKVVNIAPNIDAYNLAVKNALIFIEQLPTKEGYIEVVNESGEHIYQITEEQLAKEKAAAEKTSSDERIAALEAAIIDLMGVIQSV